MFVHKRLNARIALEPAHFERWKKLFVETVRELFEGDKAELAEQRAVSIATVMQLKISGYH
jgi:hemoglobin